MSDLIVRTEGYVGWITLNRPDALNALTWEMTLEIETALRKWREDPTVKLVIIDGAGERAFCSGGDITQMYASGRRGDLDYGRRFWRDEYRLNRKIFIYPKPIVTFLHGFTMGGGVGVGCHASHRIVCENSQIAMPECSIGLVPDVGGSLMLALAPGRVGEFLGVTGDRMDAADAIFAGFADSYIPQENWDALKTELAESGDVDVITPHITPTPDSRLAGWQAEIDANFSGDTLGDIYRAMPADPGPAVAHAQKLMARNAPFAMTCAVEIIHRVRNGLRLENALDQEFRYTYRCVEQGDFIEGIRAAIIDRDRNPQWQHASWQDVKTLDVTRMLMPLGKDALKWED
ncbi:enoyl-CoA hydratase/isomerase family protein [Yoonia litorea]|uniref:3-hydroxyisobutyryl-CoA hydrolase n=1 Tax=Yoonia litorea TaxID=1123755 RepID=A0A1I6MBN5_9RHOB|nr:enoyl-CoA hydratase/isomerase family protein [Yoonia litorea]SFS13027.1 enoyl-CoA hydratase [Yoonia litorea]